MKCLFFLPQKGRYIEFLVYLPHRKCNVIGGNIGGKYKWLQIYHKRYFTRDKIGGTLDSMCICYIQNVMSLEVTLEVNWNACKFSTRYFIGGNIGGTLNFLTHRNVMSLEVNLNALNLPQKVFYWIYIEFLVYLPDRKCNIIGGNIGGKFQCLQIYHKRYFTGGNIGGTLNFLCICHTENVMSLEVTLEVNWTVCTFTIG